MTETIEDEIYELSDDERKDIISSDVSDMEDKLSGYQMNTKMKKAWISAVYPPESEKNTFSSVESENLIAVEFLLPSDDTFIETFNFPNKRWPEDNEFRQFMENLGYYSPDKISSMVGDSVDVEYSEKINRWTIPTKIAETKDSDTSTVSDKDDTLDEILRLVLYVICGILFLSGLFLIVTLRHFGLIPAILLFSLLYIIIQFIDTL